MRGIDPEDYATVHLLPLEESADWGSELRKLLEGGEAETWYRLLYMLPIGVTWWHSPSVRWLTMRHF